MAENEAGDEIFELPDNLTDISDQEVGELEKRAKGLFRRIKDSGNTHQEAIETASALVDAISALRDEAARRFVEAATSQESMDKLAELVKDTPEPEPEAEIEEVEPEKTEEPEPVAASGKTPAKVKRPSINLEKLNQLAPMPVPEEPRLTITAATAVPGHVGEKVDSLSDVAAMFTKQAKALGITAGNPNYVPVITANRRHEQVLRHSSPDSQIIAAIEAVAGPGRTFEGMAALVAAGGWCAPSQISYDLFGITCNDGMVDLPTLGADRGGLRVPTSPSLADILGTAPSGGTAVGDDHLGAADTVPWVWTETNDMAATGQPAGPDKLCFRVPCAAFTDTRLQCFGICVTAGNLTASAWPELVADFITKLTAAQFHVNNATLIAAMQSGSTAVTGTSSATEANQGTYAPLVGNIELQAIDYRLKHGMCDNDVLEVVLPTWVRGMIRSDLAKRNGVDLLSVSDAQMAGFFNDRGVRVQYVQDWQIGVTGFLGLTTPATTWPDNVTFLIYAAGTWAKLQGLQLNLGVVRDSTLNSTNDYTAGWAEDCNTVVKIGHESRAVFVDVSATGVTAQQVDLTVAA